MRALPHVLALRRCALLIAVVALLPFTLSAAIDRHPELKSRPFAWSEYDGSFLVDTESRAEMLDFFWTVMARPYPEVGWTGSLNPPVAGETSELWRIREYAELNAYRAFNLSPPMQEAPEFLPMVQAGALVLAQNMDVAHVIDPTWIGYNELAAAGAFTSEVGGTSGGKYPSIGESSLGGGIADGLVFDFGNDALTGHRTDVLHDRTVKGTLGIGIAVNTFGYFCWRPVKEFAAADPTRCIAWPAPGYMPYALFRVAGAARRFRWSFSVLSDDSDTQAVLNATVTARINGGAPVPVRNLVRNYGVYGLTWEFDPAVFDLATAPDGTTVEITVAGVTGVPRGDTTARTYTYTVHFFDENMVLPATYSPSSPLVNMSTRGTIGSDQHQMIAGFSVAGEVPVRVAIRTQGPTLEQHKVEEFARKTHVRVRDASGVLIGENAGWKEHQDWRLLQSLGLAPTNDNEAAMVVTLWPGNYTAVVSDDTGTNGIGLVEAFNIDNKTSARLANLSTRGFVGTGERALIAGLIIKDTPQSVVIRTQGPGLARYDLRNPVSDTVLTVVDAAGHVVATNDDWETDPRNARLKTDLAAFAPTDSREAALILTLPPGGYTALVTPKGDPGVGIVEVFEF